MRVFGIPGVPLALTLAGLIPFGAGAGVMWYARGDDPVLQAQAALSLLVYAGVILSFLGGVRWGAEINANGSGIPRTRLMVLSVLGALAGWGLVLWGVLGSLGWQVFAAAAAAHVLHGVWDADGAGLANWFRRLRIFAAAGAVISLGAAAAVYLVR
ncbi:MAG: DUF3429 domain-containing protein [Acidobacteria bacterium]|nr:DUF3429 domain-containing protein [Acidobacteriota bacterium]